MFHVFISKEYIYWTEHLVAIKNSQVSLQYVLIYFQPRNGRRLKRPKVQFATICHVFVSRYFSIGTKTPITRNNPTPNLFYPTKNWYRIFKISRLKNERTISHFNLLSFAMALNRVLIRIRNVSVTESMFDAGKTRPRSSQGKDHCFCDVSQRIDRTTSRTLNKSKFLMDSRGYLKTETERQRGYL